ncbi:MAG: ParA family protein, partial [Polaromonas sp.]
MQKSSPLHPLIDIAALNAVSEHAAAVVHQVRTSMLAPHARKSPPTFNSAQMAEMCSLEVSQVQYLAKKGELPSGD